MSKSADHSSSESDPAQLLARILETSQLAQVVPHLQPQILHRVIQHCGLEDSGALVALATPAQVSAIFDLDLWRSQIAGAEEQFDADRFGVWLEVLIDAGPGVAVRTLAALDASVVTAGLAHYVRVFDVAAVQLSIDEGVVADPKIGAGLSCEIGGYQIVGRRGDAWDAIVATLIELDAGYGDAFHRVMEGCRRLSNAGREIDGLDNLLSETGQAMLDLGIDRERRREQQGYVTPAQASAFLQMSRAVALGPGRRPPPVDPITSAHLRAIEGTGEPEANGGSGDQAAPRPAPTPQESAAVAELLEVLDAEVFQQRPRALLEGASPAPKRLIQVHMEAVRERDDAAYSLRSLELGYLANVLVSGCSLQARAFTPQEATAAALAICNLGLENWPSHWQPALSDGFLAGQDLVRVFQVGWTILHEQVCLPASKRLIEVLRGVRFDDREIQAGLNALVKDLARELKAGTPWRARESIDVIAILDLLSWAALLCVIDECPTIHAALAAPAKRVLSVSSTDFEFVAENSQIAAVREFMASLPERLTG